MRYTQGNGVQKLHALEAYPSACHRNSNVLIKNMKKTLVTMLALGGLAIADDTSLLWSVDMTEGTYKVTGGSISAPIFNEYSSQQFTMGLVSAPTVQGTIQQVLPLTREPCPTLIRNLPSL